MADTDGGSTAAQRAQDPDEGNQKGLFGRLIEAFQPPEEDEENEPAAMRRVLQNLRRLRVEDVAIPKAEIVSVPVDIDRDALIALFRESGYSRVPVYEETLDHPLGLLLLKDLALEYGFNGHHEVELRPLLRPLIFVPPSMPLAVLLQKMQAERTHMALMIDEYGGVDGLVTIEDLIEQVVGEIEDEHDTDDEIHWTLEKPGSYLVLARTPLDAFEAEVGRELVTGADRDEIDTLGGLVFMLSGRVPARGEVITHDSGVVFEVIEADPRRIRRMRVRLPEAPAGTA